MKNNTEKICGSAKPEGNGVSAEELIYEIFPLMEDYFEGMVSFDGENIRYVMPDGRKFAISATKITD